MGDIELEDELYRRLAPNHIRDDGSVNSAAFKVGDEYPREISVDLARLTTPQESVNRAPKAGFKLAVMKAEAPMSLGFEVMRDPIPGNQSHSLLIGPNSKIISRQLAKQCSVVQGVVSHGSST